ncbi:MAG TPA: glycosyltransferase N-terminal domain-containing protein [Gemmatimonadaceae bacterium]
MTPLTSSPPLHTRPPLQPARAAILQLSYAALGNLARLGAIVAPGGGGKTLRAFRARRGIRARYAEWGRHGRDARKALLWVHAPSVGEGLQARPVLERMRVARPELQLAYTHFSPSAERFAHSLGADFTDYLPFDTTGDARAALVALRPRALVFSKLDVWPMLVREAAARGVRLGLISATLAEGSGRRGGFAAALLSEAYGRLDAVGAIDAGDAERLVQLGVRRAAISVTGDTRYDQVWALAQEVDRAGPLLAPLDNGRPTFVAGSTWPPDERALLAAWSEVRRTIPDARLVIAPHEPVSAHLVPIEQWAADSGARIARLGVPNAGDADVVLVDRVGVLGKLYALGDAAFVGGGFHTAGLHSVLEPAAYGAPVIFGPHFHASRDARLLVAADGGVAVSGSSEIAEHIIQWFTNHMARDEAGARARALVVGGLGAAERSAALVEKLLDD